VIEVFPPAMDQVTVSVVSTSLNIGQQATRLFSKYSRSIIHLHKYDVTPPEYTYVDLKCQGIANSPSQGRDHLVIYRIEGKQNDVSSDVFDELNYLENGQLTFKTAVDFMKSTNFNEHMNMNNYQIKNIQDGVENNDAVNMKQLNESEDSLVKFFRREMQTKIGLLNDKITEVITKVDALERQIARVLNSQTYYYKQIFEFYASTLDADEFGRSGNNITSFNDSVLNGA